MICTLKRHMPYHIIETPTESACIAKGIGVLKSHIFQAIKMHSSCTIGLSGGSTPVSLYQALAEEKDIPWEYVSLFLIDERYVPPDHKDSNQHMIRNTLVDHIVIPEENLFFPDTTRSLTDCIADYTQKMKGLIENYLPDIIVLGMGTDGHIASLFPPLSDESLSDIHLVLHTQTDTFVARDRITLALNPIAAATHHLLLLKGKEKREAWEKMLEGSEDEKRWPLKRIMETSDVSVVAHWG
jgi:6-phosphogluconolactonase